MRPLRNPILLCIAAAFAAAGASCDQSDQATAPPNHAPVIAAQSDTTMDVDSLLEIAASATDPDGDAVTYHLDVFLTKDEIQNQRFPETSFDPATGAFTFMVRSSDSPSRRFTFWARDGRGGSDSTSFTVKVVTP